MDSEMDVETLWNIRFGCCLGSFLCLCVASVVSGLYHCEDDLDVDSCIVLQCKVGSCVVGCWIVGVVILGFLYVVRRWLRESARRSDMHGQSLKAFFRRLAVEVLYIVAATLMPVASVKALDMVPEHNNVMSSAFVMSSVLLLSYAWLEWDDFGVRDTVESIFLSVQNLTIIEHHTKKHHPHHIRNMFITAGICSLGRLAVFLSKGYIRWNRSGDGGERGQRIVQGHARILDRLEARMEVVGVDAVAINLLDNLRAELGTSSTRSV